MFKYFPAPLKGLFNYCVLAVNTVLLSTPIIWLSVLKLLPIERVKRINSKVLIWLAEKWIDVNSEPLLRKDTPLIIEKLVEHNISVVLGTNGTYLTNEMMPTIKKTSLVEISLDSHDEFINNKIRLSRTASGNAFKETLKAIDLCVANQVKLKILTSLNNKNYSDLIKIADLIYTRGVRVWGISWTLFAGRAKQIYKEHVPVESKNISNEIEQTLNLIQMKYPDLKIKYSNRSNSKENNRFSFLIFPNGQAFAEDLNVGQKFPFYSLVASPLIKSWTEENYNIKQHFKRWVSDRIEFKGEDCV